MPKIDFASIAPRKGSPYPAEFNAPSNGRIKYALGPAGALNDFGVNLVHLPAGVTSSLRHWHQAEDEFIYVVAGELILRADAGEQVLRVGDCAAFPKNTGDGHHLVNRSGETAIYLEVGSRSAEELITYSDVDMVLDRARGGGYRHKDGTPY